ncbi:MAG: IS30 family transposase [Shewanella sp.]|nr:IS30 family transposase [Shewanella sp.]
MEAQPPKLGIDHSTISRELKRNSVNGKYLPEHAQNTSVERKNTALKFSKKNENTDVIIEKWITLGWSPETISQRMALELEHSDRLSRDTIYSRIEQDKSLGGKLHQYLPRFGKTRWKGGKRRKDAGVRLIPNRVDIIDRPNIVEERVRLGDWAGDTVHPKKISCPSTLVI